MESSDPVLDLLAEAKVIAQRYYALTKKPLGITGEVAEYEAARLAPRLVMNGAPLLLPSSNPLVGCGGRCRPNNSFKPKPLRGAA